MKPERIATQRGKGSDKDVRRKRDRHAAEQQLYGRIRVSNLKHYLPTVAANVSRDLPSRPKVTTDSACLSCSSKQQMSKTMTELLLQLLSC